MRQGQLSTACSEAETEPLLTASLTQLSGRYSCRVGNVQLFLNKSFPDG